MEVLTTSVLTQPIPRLILLYPGVLSSTRGECCVKHQEVFRDSSTTQYAAIFIHDLHYSMLVLLLHSETNRATDFLLNASGFNLDGLFLLVANNYGTTGW